MSDENDVQVRAVRTFSGDEGFKTPESAPFGVSRQRCADLKANGLVVEVQEHAACEKAAPTPENKAAKAPKNK